MRASLTIMLALVAAAAALLRAAGSPLPGPTGVTFLTDGRYEAYTPRFSPDDRRIAFSAQVSGRMRIFVVAAAGGAPVQVTGDEYSAASPAWSPDGSRLAFESNQGGTSGIWVIPVTGGTPSRITPAAMNATWPDWSRDDVIAFVGTAAGSRDIWTIPSGGGGARRITTHSGNEWAPRWSPDGSRIAFYSTWDGRMTDVLTVSRNGSELVPLTSHPAEDFQPAWSPDGRQIVFSSRRAGFTDLWTIPAAGGSPLRLSRNRLIESLSDWSHDGRRIAFSSFSRPQVYAVTPQTGEVVQVTSGEGASQTPAAMPGNQSIVLSFDDLRPEFYLAVLAPPSRSPQAVRMTGAPARASHRSPAVSPDGRFIAFRLNAGGFTDSSEIWAVPAHGGRARRLTSMRGADHPVWCDGSTAVAFAAGGHIWKQPFAGGAPLQLTARPDGYVPTSARRDGSMLLLHLADGGKTTLFELPSAGGALVPLQLPTRSAYWGRWSPDGSRLVYVSDDSGNEDLYVFESGVAKRVTDSPFREDHPRWTWDGRQIIFSMATERTRIAVIDAAAPVTVSSPSASRRYR